MNGIKAVISAAGFGARFFPYTIAINKCMLPVLCRPVVDYLVSDLVAAGIGTIAFVLPPGDRQVRDYFSGDPAVAERFLSRGWEDKYRPVAELRERYADVAFSYLEQSDEGPYGTAVAALVARDFVGDSDFLLLSGDDLVHDPTGGGRSHIAELIAAREASGLTAAIAVGAVDAQHISHYGIVTTRQDGDHLVMAGAVEKPRPEEVDSRLANVGRFLLPAEIFSYMRSLRPNPRSGELVSFDAVATYAVDHPVLVHPISGDYHDCGTPEAWLSTNLALSGNCG